MKLSEFLEKNNIDKVKIGCRRGSAFFYAGDTKELGLDKLNKEVYANFERKYRNAIKEYISYRKNNGRKREIEAKRKVMWKFSKKMSNYIDISEREVVASYNSIIENGVVIIILEGNDGGDFWTLEEYKTLEGRRMA